MTAPSVRGRKLVTDQAEHSDQALSRETTIEHVNIMSANVRYWHKADIGPHWRASRLGPDLARNIEAYPACLPILLNLQEGRV